MAPKRPGSDDEDAPSAAQLTGYCTARKVLAASLGVQQGKAGLSGSGELYLLLWLCKYSCC